MGLQATSPIVMARRISVGNASRDVGDRYVVSCPHCGEAHTHTAEQVHLHPGGECLAPCSSEDSARHYHVRFLAAQNGNGRPWSDEHQEPPSPISSQPLFDPATVRFGRFFEAEAPKRRMIIADFLPLGIVGLLVATGGVGKSMLLYLLALAHAAGSDFLGMPMNEVGSVLLLAAEDDEDELHRRGLRLVEHLEAGGHVDRRLLSERLHVVSRVADDNLLTRGTAGDVARTELVDRVIATAALIPDLKLIILDPVSRFRGGGANVEEDATAFVVALELIRAATGATVLAAVHQDKASLRGSGSLDQSAVRGSTALVDGVRWVAAMQRCTEEVAPKLGVRVDDASRYVRLDLVKSNYTAPWPGMWLERATGGALKPAQLSYRGRAGTATAADLQYDAVLGKLRELLRTEGPVTRSRIDNEFAGKAGLLGAGRDTVRAVISRAVVSGDLQESDDPSGRGGRLLHLEVPS